MWVDLVLGLWLLQASKHSILADVILDVSGQVTSNLKRPLCCGFGYKGGIVGRWSSSVCKVMDSSCDVQCGQKFNSIDAKD